MSARPKNPSVTVYAPVAQLYVGRYEYGSGLVCVRHDRLNYIQNMSVETAYVDTGMLYRVTAAPVLGVLTGC